MVQSPSEQLRKLIMLVESINDDDEEDLSSMAADKSRSDLLRGRMIAAGDGFSWYEIPKDDIRSEVKLTNWLGDDQYDWYARYIIDQYRATYQRLFFTRTNAGLITAVVSGSLITVDADPPERYDLRAALNVLLPAVPDVNRVEYNHAWPTHRDHMINHEHQLEFWETCLKDELEEVRTPAHWNRYLHAWRCTNDWLMRARGIFAYELAIGNLFALRNPTDRFLVKARFDKWFLAAVRDGRLVGTSGDAVPEDMRKSLGKDLAAVKNARSADDPS